MRKNTTYRLSDDVFATAMTAIKNNPVISFDNDNYTKLGCYTVEYVVVTSDTLYDIAKGKLVAQNLKTPVYVRAAFNDITTFIKKSAPADTTVKKLPFSRITKMHIKIGDVFFEFSNFATRHIDNLKTFERARHIYTEMRKKNIANVRQPKLK